MFKDAQAHKIYKYTKRMFKDTQMRTCTAYKTYD